MDEMTQPIVIAQLDPPHAGREGDWHYRTFAPGRALAALPGVHVISLDGSHRRKEAILRHADVLVLNSVVDPDLLPVLSERRGRGQVTIYEISDDVSAVPPWNPAHAFFGAPENVQLFARLAHSCDANQYSVPELRRRFGYLHGRGLVLPNQLDRVPPPRAAGQEAPVVIGWGGSRGHLSDMAALSGKLIPWLLRQDPGRVQLHLMAAEPIWRLFDALPAERKRRTPPGPLDTYYQFLEGIDIGLAPLLPTGFNLCRSDVKFLEYAAHGVVPVVQALVPYLDTVQDGRTGFLFQDHDALLAILDRLVEGPGLRAQIAGAAYHYAATERRQEDHAAERLRFYAEVLGPARGGGADFFAEVAGWPGAEVRGRHAVLQSTRYEALLAQGLVLSQQQGQVAQAVPLFQEAARLEPQNYQPYLCLAAAGYQPVDSLAEALRRHPGSIQCWIALGRVHAAQGAVGPALQCFSRAAERCPAYEAPYLRTAEVLRALGQAREADAFADTARALLAPLQAPRE